MLKQDPHEQPEFDSFDKSYRQLHQKSIGFSGEKSDFFHEYKIRDVRNEIARHGPTSALSIMDFGAGVGESIPYWETFFPDSHVTAADVSPKCLEKIAQNHPNVKMLLLHDETIPAADACFDVAFAACVFHHIAHEKHAAIFKEIYRVLKPGGCFFIFEHNPLNPLTLYVVNRCEFDANAKLLGCFKARKLMRATGFTSCTLRHRVFFPGYLSMLRPLEKCLTAIPLGGQYYICGVK